METTEETRRATIRTLDALACRLQLAVPDLAMTIDSAAAKVAARRTLPGPKTNTGHGFTTLAGRLLIGQLQADGLTDEQYDLICDAMNA